MCSLAIQIGMCPIITLQFQWLGFFCYQYALLKYLDVANVIFSYLFSYSFIYLFIYLFSVYLFIYLFFIYLFIFYLSIHFIIYLFIFIYLFYFLSIYSLVVSLSIFLFRYAEVQIYRLSGYLCRRRCVPYERIHTASCWLWILLSNRRDLQRIQL